MSKPRNWEADHLNNVEAFAQKVRLLYFNAIKEAVRMGLSVNFNPDKPFAFSDFPALNDRVKNLFESLSGKMLATIDSGTQHEWLLSASKNDDLVNSIIKSTKFPKETIDRYMDRNLDALKAFQSRKSEGLNLSDRVWKLTDQFKQELELGLDVGMAEGKSAADLARDIQSYLNDPDKLFRRVRDARGVLHLSKAAKAYSPGQGVYRSSFKNAMRVTRSEINMAYRTSDHERWQNLDFVVGFEVRRSNNPFPCVVCESLKGRYPKTFRFRQWHPQCRCNCVSILATKEEIDNLTDIILNGDDTSGFKSVNEITQMPEGWTEWISENKDRLLRAKSQPYFIKDNFKNGTVTGGLNFAIGKKPVVIKLDPVVADPKYTPSSIGEYEKKYDVKINRDIFSKLKSDVPMTTSKAKGSHYDPVAKAVNIKPDKRLDQSKWEQESIIYHEYGHAVDWANGIRDTKEVKNLMTKFRKDLQANRSQGYMDLQNKWKDAYINADKADHDTIEKIGAFADTLMSLNPGYGFGHTKAYFAHTGKKEAEFIAHAFENKFAGNSVFKEIAPELYEAMINLIDEFLAK
ncbi:hypothetical protein [Dyadobacter sp. 3J3]|uniref:hypothetical protein n=1 Tax=Dyadobacter sp. 3J3 TaxID=2606600 RepID=UPI00135727EE|nr:hypothetical protein [Dyadobacter sp. 3J3]